MQKYPLDSTLTLAEAGPIWLEAHSRYLKRKTITGYRSALKPLNVSMGELRLKEINVQHLRAYQVERGKKAGGFRINGELRVLQMILREAGEWTRISAFYKPVPTSRQGSGHTLTKDQEVRLREVAFTKPKWSLAAHCMTIMLSTTMGFGELRHLRRGDVDMDRRCVSIQEGAKNIFRVRTIPLNQSAYDSMLWILERWEKLGGTKSEQYILPHRPRSCSPHHWRDGAPWILDEPMTAIRSAFRQIRKAADLPEFRLYDCRVQAITKLLSNPAVSPQVSREIAGHVSQAMQSRYSIQLFNTKKSALDALNPPGVQQQQSPPPVAASAAPVLSAQESMQAEITRQVALAMQQHLAAPKTAMQKSEVKQRRKRVVAPPPRLLMFPGGAR